MAYFSTPLFILFLFLIRHNKQTQLPTPSEIIKQRENGWRKIKTKQAIMTNDTNSKDEDELARRRVEEEMKKIQLESKQKRKQGMRALLGETAQDVAARKKGVDESIQEWAGKGAHNDSHQKTVEVAADVVNARKMAYAENLKKNASKGKTEQHNTDVQEASYMLSEEKKKDLFESISSIPALFGAPALEQTAEVAPPKQDSYKSEFASIENEEVAMVGSEKHITITGMNHDGRKIIKTKIILPKVQAKTVSQNQSKGSTTASQTTTNINSDTSRNGDGQFYSLVDIRQGHVGGIDKSRREQYLSPEDFEDAFGMKKEEFQVLPKWKRDKLKRELHLF